MLKFTADVLRHSHRLLGVAVSEHHAISSVCIVNDDTGPHLTIVFDDVPTLYVTFDEHGYLTEHGFTTLHDSLLRVLVQMPSWVRLREFIVQPEMNSLTLLVASVDMLDIVETTRCKRTGKHHRIVA